MDRREFLKSMLGAAALATIPTPLLMAFESGESNIIQTSMWEINYLTKTIKYVGPKDRLFADTYRELLDTCLANPSSGQPFYKA